MISDRAGSAREARGDGRHGTRGGLQMRRQPAGHGAATAVALRAPALAILLLAAAALGAGEPRVADPAAAALASCRRADGTLARYLLCLELEARRPASSHAGYYAELEQLEDGILRRLPRRPASTGVRALLPRLHHAGAPATRYQVALTLADALDARRSDREPRLAADCDLFSFLNAGVGERYYGAAAADHGVGAVRIRHDHVVTAAVEQGRVTAVLETADGSTSGAPWPGDPAGLRPMSEREVVALYLANVGLALEIEGRTEDALAFFDRSLSFNPAEFVAHLGRGVALLRSAGEGDRSASCAAADGRLSAAEQAARTALEIAPEADSPYGLLGRIKLRGCAPASAEQFLEQALSRRQDPVHHYYLTLALEEQRKFERAIETARRGKRLLGKEDPSRYRALRLELDYLLAVAHTFRAETLSSESDLQKAMRHLSSIRGLRPADGSEQRLEAWIDRVDRRIGPVRREFGIPHATPRTVDASLSE